MKTFIISIFPYNTTSLIGCKPFSVTMNISLQLNLATSRLRSVDDVKLAKNYKN